ncbi:hypothetical protein EDD68_101460 [Melghiribacillus thermohalophilus]|uniref:RNA polymerase subunit sigma-70 n=1 Tax=Melghiribacillus thermohalophilus TaxID=1324956 RepID=A0A4R3NIH6_9BACI|nr:hypothetical protein [Melghiribacillus thermohalophilus]TCT27092.1 hypothetical protein EDD68_101460 [Melghiribacillus thermohalophilus]
MKISDRRHLQSIAFHDIFNMDFHQFMVLEQERTPMELAQEFGISLKDVKKLKEQLKRS